MKATPERQLAEVIQEAGVNWLGTARIAAAAIVAAVNTGTCDPIVPEGAVTIFPADNYRAEMAELAELRALKAKIDGCELWGATGVTNAVGAFRHAATLLAWLRETTDD